MFTQLTKGNVNKYFLVTMRVEGESELYVFSSSVGL